MYYNIIVARPFNQVFTYKADNKSLEIGQIVIVVFGKLRVVGLVIETDVKAPEYAIKNIDTIIEGIKLNDNKINFLKWVSNYTLAPLGSVLKLLTINEDIVTHKRQDKISSHPIFKVTKLNEEQYKVKEDIISIQKKSDKPIVLEGVTGSGKTEVYFDLIEYFHPYQ